MKIDLSETHALVAGPITSDIRTRQAGSYRFADASVLVKPGKDVPNEEKYVTINAAFQNTKFLEGAQKGDLVFAVVKKEPNTYTNRDGIEVTVINHQIEYINITKNRNNMPAMEEISDDDLPF